MYILHHISTFLALWFSDYLGPVILFLFWLHFVFQTLVFITFRSAVLLFIHIELPVENDSVSNQLFHLTKHFTHQHQVQTV